MLYLNVHFAMEVFVALTLVSLALALVLTGRSRAQTAHLSFFLGLVALNFLASAAARATASQTPLVLGLVALALDPVFLLLFVTSYPYDQRDRSLWCLLSAACLAALVGVAWTLADPTSALTGTSIQRSPSPNEWAFAFLIANLFICYLAAWFLSLRAILSAPTGGLAKRSGWISAGVGIAVLPRLGSALHNMDLIEPLRPVLGKVEFRLAIMSLMLATASVVAALGWGYVQKRRGEHRAIARRSILVASS
ncbi:MAG: hypothetical protein R3185_09405, partial [Candidatus Thermoplasmatota archaeon]|nr:hypothetical protein [Candidatus Thermoplasmatota archaeon]